MKTNVYLSTTIKVRPWTSQDELFEMIELCGEGAGDVPEPVERDWYFLPIDLISIDGYIDLETGLLVAQQSGEKRFLTLAELLSFNRVCLDIRRRYPIFTDTHVLDYEIDASVQDDCEEGEEGAFWRLSLSNFYRGQILDADSLFAVTNRTCVDRDRYSELRIGSDVTRRKAMPRLWG